MKLDTLNELDDEELQSFIGHAQGLLKQRDEDRKTKALNSARTLLASVGLNLKDLNRRSTAVRSRAPQYHTGRTYQHPADRTLVWPGKGKKPAWLTALEAEGGKAVEVDNIGDPRKKSGGTQ